MKKLLFTAIAAVIVLSGLFSSCTEDEVKVNGEGNTPPVRSDKQWD